MIPVAFEYERPSSVEEALSLLTEHGDEAKVLAGGHSLLPMMKLRLAYPSVLVDIFRLQELDYVRDAGDHLAIGALTRHRTVETNELIRAQAPLLARATSQVGDPQVRHRGTLGGALAHADTASDLPSALLALQGSVVATGPGGERVIPATELFTGFLESALAPDELLTEVRIPKVGDAGHSFQKFNRRAQDWAIVGVSAQRHNGSAAVALVNMGPVPMRATAVEEALAGGASAAEAAEQAAVGTEPASDLNASVEYREHLARVLVRRALLEAGIS